MSSITGFAGAGFLAAKGLFGAGGSPRLPKTPKSLGRMSLSDLSLRETELKKKKGRLTDTLSRREAKPFGRVGGINRKLGKVSESLTSTETAKRNLIQRGTAQRARRATSVSNLLGRGL